MRLTVMAGNGDRFLEVEVDPTEVVEGVKALVEVETGVPMDHQSLLFQGAVLANASRLDACGIKDSDMLVMVDQGGPPAPAQAAPRSGESPARQAPSAMAQNEDGSAVDPQAFRAAVLADRPLFNRLSQVNTPLARTIEAGDVAGIQKELRTHREMAREQERKEREEQELLMADPFDPATQAKIEERIRQQNIDLNLEVALEHNPEQFVAVHMLYVEMEVNAHPIKAFIDSGAQQTIMSESCAERCGLARLLDKRFHGMAVGVGTSKIVGIIHAVPLKIGPNFYSCRISVLENLTTDFLFGLDMLRRHQCCIDLQANALRVGGGEHSAPFLAEKDCPKKDEMEVPEPAAKPESANAAGPSTRSAPSAGNPAPPGDLGSAAAAAAAAPAPASAAASAPAAAAAAAPAPQSSQLAASSAMEQKVAKLMELGFTREQVLEALAVTSGNEEQAAGLLFGGF